MSLAETTESREQRSRTMRSVKGKNTAPELAVRKLVHAMGYPIPAAQGGSSGAARSRLPKAPQDHLRQRLLLARTPMCSRQQGSGDKHPVLD